MIQPKTFLLIFLCITSVLAHHSVADTRPARPYFDHSSGLYMFDGAIEEADLHKLLDRSVTHVGLCDATNENTKTMDDDIRMLKNIDAKFIGRTAFAWETAHNDNKHFERVKTNAVKVHAELPHVILQACIFEIVQPKLNRISIPDWVFTEFDLPVEKRNFNYQAMLYQDGHQVDHWRNGSVPDMSQLETRMWFYYRARRYIDSGMEAIHFGQVMLMDDADEDLTHWYDMLSRVRAYAREHARRQIVLCDAHTHGSKHGDRLLFDFHSFPLRADETKGKPLEAHLRIGAGRIFKRSKGGISPSGWECKHLPYIVEFDNWGYSGKGGQEVGGIWIWGYDDMSWFAEIDPYYRVEFLEYAIQWLKQNDPAGHLQIPTRRRLASEKTTDGGIAFFAANTRSEACPDGANAENTIKHIWNKLL